MPDSIREITAEVRRINKEVGYDAGNSIMGTENARHTLAMLALIHTEVSEAAQEVRLQNPRAFANELTDVFLRLCDLAGGHGIDLVEIAWAKTRLIDEQGRDKRKII